MTDKTIAVIDLDLVLYKCSAANEKRSIIVINKVTGDEKEYDNRTAFKKELKPDDSADNYDILDKQTPEKLSHAIQMVKTSIEGYKKSCKADSVELYIGGKGNFRESLPLPSQYKGNRKGTLKPVQLKECVDYAVRKLGAVVVDGQEADDMLATRCYWGLKNKVKVIAVTVDGDQQGVEGYYYNPSKMFAPKLIQGLGEIHLTKERKDFDGEGRKFFYAQFVYGDWGTDHFKPSQISGKSFGVVAMYNLLKDCKTDKECVEAVYKQYKDWYPNGATYTDWQGVERTKTTIELMDMYAHCAHMRRFEGDVFDTEKLLNNLGIQL